MSCLNAGLDAATTWLHVTSFAVIAHSVLLLAADVSTMCIPDVCKRLDQSLVSLLPWANKYLSASTEQGIVKPITHLEVEPCSKAF